MVSRRAACALLVGLLVVSQACGSVDDGAPTTSETPGTVASSLPPEDPGIAGGGDRSEELLGRWDVANYVLPDGGGLTNVVGSDPVFIEFNADSTISYGTGCNSGGSEFVTSGTYYVPESALDDRPEGQSIVIVRCSNKPSEAVKGSWATRTVICPPTWVP